MDLYTGCIKKLNRSEITLLLTKSNFDLVDGKFQKICLSLSRSKRHANFHILRKISHVLA